MKLEKVIMKKRYLKTVARRGNLGFTAIEIAMVAAVIAILSLIALPIFRNRVDEAKIAAAQADLNAMMKAQQVIKADIDAYARLEDLDNIELNGYTGPPPGGVTNEVPFFKYVKPSDTLSPDPNSRQVLTTNAQRGQLAGIPDHPVWRGPYVAFQRHVKYEDLRDATQYPNAANYLRSLSGDPYAAIQDFPTGTFSDADENRIPIDPWGNPYLFFPPNGNSADPVGANAYSSAVIYSMGPDGMPGDGGVSAQSYTRTYAITNPTAIDALGQGDDLMVEF